MRTLLCIFSSYNRKEAGKKRRKHCTDLKWTKWKEKPHGNCSLCERFFCRSYILCWIHYIIRQQVSYFNFGWQGIRCEAVSGMPCICIGCRIETMVYSLFDSKWSNSRAESIVRISCTHSMHTVWQCTYEKMDKTFSAAVKGFFKCTDSLLVH